MNKSLLLAGVACLMATSANAGMMDSMKKAYHDMTPYIGADYAYSNLDLKGPAKGSEENFNTAKINAGVDIGKYMGLEAFYQFGGSRKAHLKDGTTSKFKFNAYGLDLYGYMPLGCAQKFSLVGTAGIAMYDTELKHNDKVSKSRVGYRVGGGAQYKMTDRLAARVIGRYGYVGGKELNHVAEVTAGLRYSF
ncbi:MAG: porin family protein [Alphaproteobacteria bacterium]|nr:porin family protein [Alphaproteobacteria bacterium]